MTEGHLAYDTTCSSLLMSHKVNMDNRDCARLIDYYRIKIESFDKERIEMLEKLEGLRIAQEDFQKTQWELQKRSDEVYELQKALSETNNALNYERRQVINLTAELESYKLKVKEDRIRMIKLLKLAEPIEQTVKLYQDRRPQMLEKFSNSNSELETEELMSNYLAKSVRMTTRANRSFYNENATSPTNSVNKNRGMSSTSNSFYIKSGGNSNKNLFNKSCSNFSFVNTRNKNESIYKSYTSSNCAKTNCSRSNSKKTSNSNNNLKNSFRSSCNKTFSPRLEMRIAPRDEKQQIIRTIIMPSDKSNNISTNATGLNENSINEENEFLRKQLLEMKTYYENLLSKMEEDNKLKEEEEKLKNKNDRQTIEDLSLKNNKLEKNTYEITKELMQLKYDFNLNEKKLYEEIETLKLQVEALTFTLDEVVKKFELERTSTRIDYEGKTKEISIIMRNQVKKHEENISIIKEQYKQIQKIYVAKVQELEEKLFNLTNKIKISQKQKNLENEGYKNEINLMRKRVKSFEEFVVKLRKLTYGLTDKSNKIHETLRAEQEKFFSELNDFNDDLDIIQEKLRTENIKKTNTLMPSQRSRSQSQSKHKRKDSQSNNKI